MYCTLVCCMDGRFIIAITEFIRVKFGYVYVDTITDAGPVSKIIYDNYLTHIEENIRLISIDKHQSKHIFITGHHDCAGCLLDDQLQKMHIKDAARIFKNDFPDVRVTGIFIDENFSCNIVEDLE